MSRCKKLQNPFSLTNKSQRQKHTGWGWKGRGGDRGTYKLRDLEDGP